MIDLLISPAAQLLTLSGAHSGPRRRQAMSEIGLVEGGALGINTQSGLIEYAGQLSELNRSELTEDCKTIDASGCVVMPGFIDSHTHILFAGSRADEFHRRARSESYQQIAEAGGGIRNTMDAVRAASEDELFDGCRKRLRMLHANGTTTVEIKSGYGLNHDAEMKSLRAICRVRDSEPGLVFSTFMGAHLVPPEFKDNRAEYVELVAAMLPEVEREGLADFYDIFVDPLAFTHKESDRIVEAGSQTSLGLRLHGDEFGDDGTAAWAAGKGAISVDHLGGIGDGGIEALAASDTIATLLPSTMFYTGHDRYAPARRMIEAGCAVSLASDLNPGSSMVYSMPFVMTLAALKMQMSPEECITAVTANAAHALGIGKMVGSLAPGMRADVVILDLPHYNEIPCHIGRDIVRDVLINGHVVKRGGVFGASG